MSELKIIQVPKMTNIFGRVIGINEYYLKSEADKVIAELEEKLKVQTSIAEEGWKEAGTYHTSYAEAVKELYDKNKELRHHKYKRCLDKAKWCESEENRLEAIAPVLTPTKSVGNTVVTIGINGASVGWNLPRNSRRRSDGKVSA